MSVQRKHDRDLPRGWFNLFIRLGGWSALIAGLVVMIVFGITLANENAAAEFAKDGRTTDATVIGRRVEQSTDSDGDTTYTYYIEFRFQTRAGETMTVERTVAKKFYANAGRGDMREIRYLASDPSRIEYYVGEKAYRTRVGLWIGGIVGTIGLAGLAFAGDRTNRAILARRDGENQVARVSEVKRLKVEVNDRVQGRLHWTGPDGLNGRSLMRDYVDLSRYSPGDQITVFRRGKDVWWEGDVGPKRTDLPEI